MELVIAKYLRRFHHPWSALLRDSLEASGPGTRLTRMLIMMLITTVVVVMVGAMVVVRTVLSPDSMFLTTTLLLQEHCSE